MVHAERAARAGRGGRTGGRALTPRVAALLLGLALAGCGPHPAWLEPAESGPDFALQGEYAQPGSPFAVQVIATGDGAFRAVRLAGGLPGAGFDGRGRSESDGRREGDGVRFDDGSAIEGGAYRGRGTGADGVEVDVALPRVLRASPTEGLAPPDGAVVVFGAGTGRFEGGGLDPRGFLRVGATSRDRFQDHRVHLELRTPFMPDASGQARGNSGVYLQSRYEVQVLDSFGLAGEWNECGGIYGVRKPTVNMAFPPLSWQTYDIEFTPARFDASGRKREPARISVRHNGVSIQEDVELPEPTGGGDDESPEPGPLLLQDHGDPVVFRNVWVLPIAR